MKRLSKWVKVLTVSIFYLAILVIVSVLAVSLIAGILISKMRFLFKHLMILFIGVSVAVVFAAAWEGTRKSIGQNFGR